jgi:glycine cleavage system H protein
MPDDLVFLMGKYEARIPTDRRYSRNHMYLLPLPPIGDAPAAPGAPAARGRYRVGLTAYSVRLLQDVYFLDWAIDADTEVTARQEIGEVESSKAVSALYTPCAGRLTAFNELVLSDPAGINADNYGAGWLYELETDAATLTPEEYVAHLEAGWEKDQRMIKGQVN